MKKFLVIALSVLVIALSAYAFTDNGQKTAGSAAGQRAQLITGACTVIAVDVAALTSNAAAIPDGTVFGLCDIGNTYTASAWKVTLTASTGLKTLGLTAVAPNGSGRGIVYGGIPFTTGVVIDTGDATTSSVTITASTIVK